MINLKNRHINRTTMDELYSRLPLPLTPATSGSSAQAVLINDLPSFFPSWLSILVFLYTEANGACQRTSGLCSCAVLPQRGQGPTPLKGHTCLCLPAHPVGWPGNTPGKQRAFYPGFGAVSVHRREESQVLLV